MIDSLRILHLKLTQRTRRFFPLLLLLSLSIFVFFVAFAIRDSLLSAVSNNKAALMGGDAEISMIYRFADDVEHNYITTIADEVSEIANFRAMLSTDSATNENGELDENGELRTALAEIDAVDKSFPLYGSFQLLPDISVNAALANKGIILSEQLATRLRVDIGAVIRLGGEAFTFRALMLSHPEMALRQGGLTPKAIVDRRNLASTDLLADGSLFTSHYRLKINDKDAIRDKKAEAMGIFSKSGWQWRDVTDEETGISGVFDRLTEFLILCSTVALTVCLATILIAARVFYQLERKDIAVLKMLGRGRRQIMLIYFAFLFALLVISYMIGAVLGFGAVLLILGYLQESLNFQADLMPSLRVFLASFLFGAGLVFVIMVPMLFGTLRLSIRDAFTAKPIRAPVIYSMLGLVLLALGLYGLDHWFALGRSFVLGLAIIAAVAFTLYFATRILKLILRGRNIIGGGYRAALADLAAPNRLFETQAVTIGLSLFLLGFVVQFGQGVVQSIPNISSEKTPSLFLLDIKNDQLDEFESFAKTFPSLSQFETAPMLRGLVAEINDKPAAAFGDHWIFEGDRGITFSDEKPPTVTLVEGEWWREGEAGLPGLAMSADIAQELGVGLGDKVVLNILGRDIAAEIRALHETNFETLQINFIFHLARSALENAPFTNIATVTLSKADERALIEGLAMDYPNITAISIRNSLNKITKNVEQVVSAITAFSVIVIFFSVLSVLILAYLSLYQKRLQVSVFQILGQSRMEIGNFFIWSSMFSVGIPAIFAGTLAYFAADFALWEIFETRAATAISGLVVAMLVAWLVYTLILTGFSRIYLLQGLGLRFRDAQHRI